jgi:hypothetical protein
MWERGDAWLALAYAFGSVFAGLLAVALGVTLARYVAPEVSVPLQICEHRGDDWPTSPLRYGEE